MQTFSDIEIIESVLTGNKNDYGFLIDRYQDKAYSLCLSILKNEDDAQEAAHLSFIKAYENLMGFKKDAKFSTWFYRICYNQCISDMRYGKKFNRSFEPEDKPDLSSSELNQGISYLSLKEQQKYIQLSLDELPPADSFLIQSYYLDQLDLKEITEVSGMSMSNVKVRLHRARKKMYCSLEKLLKNELLTLIDKV